VRVLPLFVRREPIRALSLLFLTALVVVSAAALIQVQVAGAAPQAMAICAAIMGCLILLRALEFRTGRLVPFPVDLLELTVVGALLLELQKLDPVLGPVYFLLFFRAATGRLRRVLPMIIGYVVVTLAGSVAVGLEVMPGAYVGMAVISLLMYGMRSLLMRLREEHHRQSRMLGDVLSRLPLPVLVLGADGDVVLANPAAAALTGPLDEVRARTPGGRPVELRSLAEGQQDLVLNDRIQVVVETVPTEHGTIVALLDVTAQRDYEERLEHAAYHDALTGLPNRAELWRRFEVQSGDYAVLLVDLDGFKAINDTYGHLAGDELLCQVAERLRHVCGRNATVARLGGDEFAVLVPGAGTAEATATAAAIRDGFAWEVPLAAGPVRVGGSIGFALGGPDRSPDEVLAAADVAMYTDKYDRRMSARR
jgi:diguanylate cyclase (GGDEF)-like protein